MTLRLAAEADLSAILAMRVEAATWLQSRGIAQWNPDGFTLDETREDFAINRIFVLEDGTGRLAGSFVLHDDDPKIWPDATAGEAYYLHRLVTVRERAGQGLGAVLLKEARRVASDVRAVQIQAALDAGDDGDDIARWCADVASQRRGDVLLDSHDATAPHLWGHVQEGVLAMAATALGRSDLIEIARRSADAYLVPLIARGFDLHTVQPYGAASAAFAMEQLDAACGDGRYAAAARDARAWFDGRNPAGRPVYDRAAGRVADGIDGGRVNPHSGAESNILGAQAFIGDVAAWLERDPEACTLTLAGVPARLIR